MNTTIIPSKNLRSEKLQKMTPKMIFFRGTSNWMHKLRETRGRLELRYSKKL